jgi:putative cell wall-binding protein
MELLAGGGSSCRLPLEGDGGPAAKAALGDPVAVATDGAGTTYVAERFGGRIRRIAPDGTIRSVVGAYSLACTGPTFPRSPVQGTVDGLAVSPDGTLWATTPGCLYEIRTDGVVRCVEDLRGGPGRPAGGVAALADGSVVFSDPLAHQVRRRAADGTVSVVAGSGRPGCGADGAPAATSPLGLPGPLTVAQDGTLVVYDAACHALRTVGGTPERAVTRLSGPDRLVTGVEIARAAYAPGTARAAVLARSDAFADALAGAPLAAHVDGPLLLTARTGLSAWTESQLRAALPAGAAVHVLGGTGAVSPAVDARLRVLGFRVVRHAGADRYATAAAIARDGIGTPTATFVTTGLSFPDALSASAAAASTGGAVLLTAGAAVPAATAAHLSAHPTPTTYAVGGPAVLAAPDAVALAGDDRYATSAAVAARLFPAPPAVALATGTAFADALTGAAAAATEGAPLLLTPPTSLSASARGYLDERATAATPVLVYGGRAAVSDAVTSQVRSVLAAP